MSCLKAVPSGVEIHIKVVPGASRNHIVGRFGDALKIQVSAPPEKGQANKAVVKLLADALGMKARDVIVVAGHAAPRKWVRIIGAGADHVRTALGLQGS